MLPVPCVKPVGPYSIFVEFALLPFRKVMLTEVEVTE